MKILSRPLFVFLIIFLLSACSKSFIVVSDIPKPLVQASSNNVVLKYSDEFRNFEYSDGDSNRALEKVAFGSAQVYLFDQIFSGLFNVVDENSDNIDLIIAPQVVDFQYSIPAETKSTQYEVWLKYRITIIDNNSAEIADWVVKGFGKTPKTGLSSHLKLFNQASNIALRDVGAQLAIGFRSQPAIKAYLETGAVPSVAAKPNKQQVVGLGDEQQALQKLSDGNMASIEALVLESAVSDIKMKDVPESVGLPEEEIDSEQEKQGEEKQ